MRQDRDIMDKISLELFTFLDETMADLKKTHPPVGGCVCTQRVRPKNRRFEKILFERVVLS